MKVFPILTHPFVPLFGHALSPATRIGHNDEFDTYNYTVYYSTLPASTHGQSQQTIVGRSPPRTLWPFHGLVIS